MLNWRYLGGLAGLIGLVMGYGFAMSEVQTIQVVGKHVEDVKGRRGVTKRFVIETDGGSLPLLSFPVIGFGSDVETAFEQIGSSDQITARVGQWPPFPGGRPHVYAIH